jgi:uncharacterized protein with HEPN domain
VRRGRIGEAVNSISLIDPELAARISHGRKIVGFRNQLVHDYPAIIVDAVWAIADRDAPILREECNALIDELRRADQPRDNLTRFARTLSAVR